MLYPIDQEKVRKKGFFCISRFVSNFYVTLFIITLYDIPLFILCVYLLATSIKLINNNEALLSYLKLHHYKNIMIRRELIN